MGCRVGAISETTDTHMGAGANNELNFHRNISEQFATLKGTFLELRSGTYEDSVKFFPLIRKLEEDQKILGELIKADLNV
jgi:hypothetical protein